MSIQRERAPSMNKTLNPASLPKPLASYSHGVVAPPGARFVFTSGQLGIGPDGLIPDDFEAQAANCFEAIKAILAEAGMGMEHVVRFNAFVTDRSYFQPFGAVRARYVSGSAYASTLIIVSGFSLPQFKLELEATAAKVD